MYIKLLVIPKGNAWHSQNLLISRNLIVSNILFHSFSRQGLQLQLLEFACLSLYM